jgi:hypothetical protein
VSDITATPPPLLTTLRITTEDGGLSWSIIRGNPEEDFVTVAQCIPDKETARRIAATEEMLHALKSVCQLYQQHLADSEWNSFAVDQMNRVAHAAIVKATGKEAA